MRRPQDLLADPPTAHGLRAAQASLLGDGTRVVDVWLYSKPPAQLVDPPPAGSARPWSLQPSPGGAAVDIVKAESKSDPSAHVRLTLSGLPDTSRYRLVVTPPSGLKFDPLRVWLPVRLRPECPDLGSCFEPPPVAPPAETGPALDYGARDWRALRGALVEQLVAEDPEADLSLADPTIAAIELFAHIGDLLHYRLDRVATEAYLETARLRTSVKRHARLVDFHFSDGVAARTFVHMSLTRGTGPVNVMPGDVASDAIGSPRAFTIDPAPGADPSQPALVAHDSLCEMAIYDWGEPGCCLPLGATECVLVRPVPADPLGAAWLEAGDLLAFELVGPVDRDKHLNWSRRDPGQLWPPTAAGFDFRPPLPGRPAQVVELISVEPFDDPLAVDLAGRALELSRVRWRSEDALTAPYPVAIDDQTGIDEVAVVRANIARAHHGRLVDGDSAETLRARLPESAADGGPVAAYELTACGLPPTSGRSGGPGLSLREDGVPHRLDVDVKLPSGLVVQPEALTTLLDADPGEFAVVVDVEQHDPPLMRFGSGAVGVVPPAGSEVRAAYEVGGGAGGNVPPGAVSLLERNFASAGSTPDWRPVGGVTARNPVAATGGADPTPLDAVRRDAPEAFAALPLRAVLPADHAATAMETGLVQRATAQSGWTGSWPIIRTLVDLDEEGRPEDMVALQGRLDDVRMLGTEALALPARVVGLLLALDICLLPGSEPELVRQEALSVLRPGDDAHPGVFHRSRLELGGAVYVSTAVAKLAALPHVDAVLVREARRLDEPQGTVRAVIAMAGDEVAALDDNPARPERGRLDISVRSGR